MSTYNGTKSTKTLSLNSKLKLDITNHHVIIIDDIFDTGYTLDSVFKIVLDLNPKSVKSCVLVSKQKERDIKTAPDYIGFTILDEFVVGYGLDYNESFRNLPYVGILDPAVYS